ncbi:serine aminopeptidase domain-containing protein [Terriglobus sp. RCC_193]|uniref:serine aminopeptidase domain-containing protein n=1 Tax=Terriglobus sp. RCC_193 TaxID=3239218 RepID=UPI003526A927
MVCSAYGQEEMCTHYGVMGLADELALAGVPTLRFDYLGACNSDDGDVCLRGFVEDTVRAVECLRQHCGPLPVVLAGVRLGAMVALSSSGRVAGVAGVVLMAPVLSGRTYMREVRAAAAVSRLASLDPPPQAGSGEVLNTNGFHWSAMLQDEVSTADLTHLTALHAPLLVLPSPQDRQSPKVAEKWAATGAPVSVVPFAEYGTWMQDPTLHSNPVQAFAAIRNWLKELPAVEEKELHGTLPGSTRTLRGEGFMEEPVRFGPDQSLFGILCLPADGKAAEVAALLLHEGSSYTIGNGRAYVKLARTLARQGIASLRIDLSATGDSPARNTRHPHYDLERIPESVAALDLLQQRGFPVAVAFGQCAGAYTAYQVVLADERIVGGVITNIQKFTWHYGDDIAVSFRDNKRSLKGYWRAMRSKGEWKRVLRGDADMSGIVRVLLKRGFMQVTHQVKSLLPPAPDSEMAIVHAQMRRLAQRGVQLHLLFSDDDPGLSEMWMQFGRKARRLKNFAPIRMTLVKHADHHFNGSDARERFYELASVWMKEAVASRAASIVVR